MEIAALNPEDRKEFLADPGLDAPASARFIRAAFRMLNLILFLTHGPDECPVWPIHRDSTAVLAAGAVQVQVHSDIVRGFIWASASRT